jgi:hypothetical protein
MKLSGLKPLFISIKKNDLTYGTFKYQVNEISFEIFFDISVVPYQLGFIQRQSTFQLWLDVKSGFEINPVINNQDYKSLVKILQLKYNPDNPFKPQNFFDEFNKKIPNTYSPTSIELLHYVSTQRYDVEEKEKLYFNKFMPWKSQKRSKENLEKTRLLLPKIYNRIKDRPNISVGYTNINKGIIDKEIPSEYLEQ